jgi:hypothetical protein
MWLGGLDAYGKPNCIKQLIFSLKAILMQVKAEFPSRWNITTGNKKLWFVLTEWPIPVYCISVNMYINHIYSLYLILYIIHHSVQNSLLPAPWAVVSSVQKPQEWLHAWNLQLVAQDK